MSFNQLDDRNMARIRYREGVRSRRRSRPLRAIVKGYEITQGRYVMIDPDELEPFVGASDLRVG